MNFFCSVEHVEAWRATSPNVAGYSLTLAEAAELGRGVWGELVRLGSRSGE